MTTQIQLRKSTDIILKKSDKIFNLTSKILNKSALSIAVNTALAIHDDSEILELMKWLDDQDLLPHYVLAQPNEWVNDTFESYQNKNTRIPTSVIEVLIKNPYFKITDEFLDKFRTQIDWDLLVNQEHYQPSIQLFAYDEYFSQYRRHDIKRTILRRAKDTADHDIPQNTQQGYQIAANVNVDWSMDFIVKHQEHLCFRELSKNPAIPFTDALICEFADKWDYEELAKNPSVIWSKALINLLNYRGTRFGHNGLISILVKNVEMFDKEMVIDMMTYKRDHFSQMSIHDILYVAEYDDREVINKWFEMNITDFEIVKDNPEEMLQRNLWLLEEGLICCYPDFPWSMEFIVDNAHYFEWDDISYCPYIKWDLSTIKIIDSYIDWSEFGNDINLLEGEKYRDFLALYKDNIQWTSISYNERFALTTDDCREFFSYIVDLFNKQKHHLLVYGFIDWNIETMELFKDHINWKDFLEIEDVHLPYHNDERTKELMDWVFENREAKATISEYKMKDILSKIESADELKCFFEFAYDRQDDVHESIFLYDFTQMVRNKEWKGEFSQDFMKMLSENDTGRYKDLWVHYACQDWKEIDKEFLREYRYDMPMEVAASNAIARLYPIDHLSLDKLKELTKEAQKERLSRKV